MSFMQGWLAGQRVKPLGDHGDLLAAIRERAALQDVDEQNAKRRFAEHLGLVKRAMPGYQRGDPRGHALMVALGLAKPPETDEARAERIEARDYARGQDAKRIGLQEEGMQLRKEDAAESTRRFEKTFGFTKAREETRKTERAGDIARRKGERAEDIARRKGERAEDIARRKGEWAEDIALRKKSLTLAQKRDARRDDIAFAGGFLSGGWRGMDDEEFAKASKRLDALSAKWGVADWDALREYVTAQGYRGPVKDILERPVTPQDKMMEQIGLKKQEADAVAEATGIESQKVLRRMFGLKEPEDKPNAGAVMELQLEFKKLDEKPQEQATFTRKIITRAKAGDKDAEEYLRIMLSSGLDR